MLLVVQNLTAVDALALLTPYDDSNDNSTAHLFLDIDDGYTLKGIFFDSLAVNNKVIKPISMGGVAKQTYHALLTQAAVAAPVDTVLENTIDGAVPADPFSWAYNGVGDYRITKVGAFPDADKICIGFGVGTDADANYFQAYVDADNMDIFSSLNSTAAPANDILTKTPITIVVYS